MLSEETFMYESGNIDEFLSLMKQGCFCFEYLYKQTRFLKRLPLRTFFKTPSTSNFFAKTHWLINKYLQLQNPNTTAFNKIILFETSKESSTKPKLIELDNSCYPKGWFELGCYLYGNSADNNLAKFKAWYLAICRFYKKEPDLGQWSQVVQYFNEINNNLFPFNYNPWHNKLVDNGMNNGINVSRYFTLIEKIGSQKQFKLKIKQPSDLLEIIKEGKSPAGLGVNLNKLAYLLKFFGQDVDKTVLFLNKHTSISEAYQLLKGCPVNIQGWYKWSDLIVEAIGTDLHKKVLFKQIPSYVRHIGINSKKPASLKKLKNWYIAKKLGVSEMFYKRMNKNDKFVIDHVIDQVNPVKAYQKLNSIEAKQHNKLPDRVVDYNKYSARLLTPGDKFGLIVITDKIKDGAEAAPPVKLQPYYAKAYTNENCSVLVMEDGTEQSVNKLVCHCVIDIIRPIEGSSKPTIGMSHLYFLIDSQQYLRSVDFCLSLLKWISINASKYNIVITKDDWSEQYEVMAEIIKSICSYASEYGIKIFEDKRGWIFVEESEKIEIQKEEYFHFEFEQDTENFLV